MFCSELTKKLKGNYPYLASLLFAILLPLHLVTFLMFFFLYTYQTTMRDNSAPLDLGPFQPGVMITAYPSGSRGVVGS